MASSALLPDELMKRVRLIEMRTRKVVNDAMTGQYRSHFKGAGVQFSEHRLYVPGDDVRHIDWRASARARDPLVKKYEEERQLNVLLVIDASGSGHFGSASKTKSEIIAELGGMLAFAANSTGDKVGAIFFGGSVERVVPPRKGRSHVLRLIRDMLAFEAKDPRTGLKEALEAANRLMKHAGIVIVLSDFIADDYENAFKRLARKNDVVAIQVVDEREHKFVASGLVRLVDPETGRECVVNPASYRFQRWLKDEAQARENALASALRGARADVIRVATHEDYGEALVRFFRSRGRRGGQGIAGSHAMRSKNAGTARSGAL